MAAKVSIFRGIMPKLWGKNMLHIGILREEKQPEDFRVPLSPAACADLQARYPLRIFVEPSSRRCFSDQEYADQGIALKADLSGCEVLLGVKEVPVSKLIEGKTYMFFSHTKKKQPYNQPLMQALIQKKIRMIDYECLTYEDEQRLLGFGLYAGIVGAHNGLWAYGKKWGEFALERAYALKTYARLQEHYSQIKLPAVKIVVTGSGKVAAGVMEVMTHFDIEPVEPRDFLAHSYDYPVYTVLKGGDLYSRKSDGGFSREDFHKHPEKYRCLFPEYLAHADILMNGIYWESRIDRLFSLEDLKDPRWRISVISDITCDLHGSVPINLGSTNSLDPAYGVDRRSLERVSAHQRDRGVVDILAVDNLPNELPRDASTFFGRHLGKLVIPELLRESSDLLERATICRDGHLSPSFEYLADYAYGQGGKRGE